MNGYLKQEYQNDLKSKQGKNIGITTNSGTIISRTLGGQSRDSTDLQKSKHGRLKNEGFSIGKYIQTPPLIFTRDHHPMPFGDMYRGGSCFIIAGGPSFLNINKQLLNKPGVLTMGINNSVKVFRPNLWCCVDDPDHFIKSIWYDPKITKFVPFSHSQKNIFDNQQWKMTENKVGDCPNTYFFMRNQKFNASQFLYQDTINWGNHGDHGGGRSVLHAAIRLLFFMGIRNIFLLGVDFKMDENIKYSFQQDRNKSSINGNNSTYSKMKQRFAQLNPYFKQAGLNIYNCNPQSGLKQFQFIKFEQAIKFATQFMPKDIQNERTSGLYDRKSNLKNQQNQIIKNIGKKPTNKIKMTKKQVDAIKNALSKQDFQKSIRDIQIIDDENTLQKDKNSILLSMKNMGINN